MRIVKLCLILVFGLGQFHSNCQQNDDALYIKSIHDNILKNGKCYSWLTHLSENIGGRLAGSPESVEAIAYTQSVLDKMGLDRVWVQPCSIPNYWTRGEKEVVEIIVGKEKFSLACASLGGSPSTTRDGIQAKVVEVHSLDQVEQLGRVGIEGKIVFFNRPMDPTKRNPFRAYGGAVDQRVNGPAIASRFGAIGCLVRSMTTRIDDIPHTGVTAFRDGISPIPAIAISTLAANKLSDLLKQQNVEAYLWCNSQNHGPARSFNVIGEIKGSLFPDEIILVGGHLDSWDIGGGANDDGAGCVQAMEVIYRLRQMNYKPKRTIRCVLFMNEENGLGGGNAYADSSRANGEYHLAAIESDAGGSSPRGFNCMGHEDTFIKHYKSIQKWNPLFEAYDLLIKKGGAGADINPLKFQKGMLFGLRVDGQRYFDYHHTKIDRIDAVHPRELKLGAAAMTSLVYLIDQYGLSRD